MTTTSMDSPIITDPRIVAAVEQASELDRKWFERHRDRAHRVRRSTSGEHPVDLLVHGPTSWPVHVIVKQAAVGVRVKIAVRSMRTPCSCETCAADLWDRFACDKTRRIALLMAATTLRGKQT